MNMYSSRGLIAFFKGAKKMFKKVLFILAACLFIYYTIGKIFYIYCTPQRSFSEFEGFDNETGAERPIVPNIVHFLVTSPKTGLTFMEAICMLAALKNQNPDFIYIHTDLSRLEGYWDSVMEVDEFKKKLVLKTVELPYEVFGQRLNPYWRHFHGSDLIRISILRKYGGVYLDNDSFVVRNIDWLRKYEMVLGMKPGSFLGTQVLVAHKDARFLELWHESYRRYKPWLWYWNAGEKPTRDILWKRPELIHNVPDLLGVENGFPEECIFHKYSDSWTRYYSIHLLTRGFPKVVECHNYTQVNGSVRPMISSVVSSFPMFAESVSKFGHACN